MAELTKRGPGRPRKEPSVEPVESAPVPPGPFTFEFRFGPPGQAKVMISRPAYAYTIDQQSDKVVITGVLRPTSDV